MIPVPAGTRVYLAMGYLRDVVARIADHPINRLAELLPWNSSIVRHGPAER